MGILGYVGSEKVDKQDEQRYEEKKKEDDGGGKERKLVFTEC